MNKLTLQRLLLILSLLGIALLIIISQNQKSLITGTIEKIDNSNGRITIKLENETTKLILFEKTPPKIRAGDHIQVFGKEETYRGKKQIIVDKIKTIR